MPDYRRGAHTVFAIHLHLVWTTKYRKPVLTGEVALRVRDLVREISETNIKKQYWGQHMWARGYFCCSTGNVTDEIVAEYITNQTENRDDDFKVEG